jgi:shikimate dehydrogenase
MENKNRRFGLIGKTLNHSFSKLFFSEKFKNPEFEGFSYENFELKDIKSLSNFTKTTAFELKGFNVTIPYKKEIIPFLNELNPIALEIGAVNTVVVKNDQLIGYNTDFYGFLNAIKPHLQKQHQKALILGTGGASKAIAYTFKTLNIPFLFASRHPENGIIYSKIDKTLLTEYQIIVNTTPVGTFPNIEDYPNIPYQYLNESHLVFDLIYNPQETQFLKKAKKMGSFTCNGLTMLELQAEKAWEIWQKD